MSDAKAIDRSLDAVETEIEKLRAEGVSALDQPKHYRLQQLYLRRDELHKRQFRALQKKIARMPK